MQQRQYERTPEQEKIEKRRQVFQLEMFVWRWMDNLMASHLILVIFVLSNFQVPFHMHINLELLECVYLTSAMLMEIPWMAGMSKKKHAKCFHLQVQQLKRLTGRTPPENKNVDLVVSYFLHCGIVCLDK